MTGGSGSANPLNAPPSLQQQQQHRQPVRRRYVYGQASIAGGTSVLRGLVLLVVASLWVYALPVLLVIKAGPEANGPVAVPAAYLGTLLAMCAMSIALAFAYREPRVTHLRRCVVKRARNTWLNISAYIAITLEALFIVAAVFAAPSTTSTTESSWWTDAANALFLDFGTGREDEGAATVPVGVYVALGVMALHFLLAAMPIVGGTMLRWRRAERLTNSAAWVAALQYLGVYLLPFVTRNVARLMACDGDTGAFLASAGTSADETLVACYAADSGHRRVAIAALVLFTYYAPSTLMRNSAFDEAACAPLDVVFPPLFRQLTATAVLVGVAGATLVGSAPQSAVLAAATSAIALAVTLVYPRFVNGDERELCTVRSAGAAKAFAYFAAAVACACIAGASAGSEEWAAFTSIALCAAAVPAALVFTWLRGRGELLEGAEECRQLLLDAADTLAASGRLHTRQWRTTEARWRSAVRGGVRASTFAVAAMALERAAVLYEMPPLFVASRRAWCRRARRIVAPADAEAFVDVATELWRSDWEVLLFCCGCDCCSHERDPDSDRVKVRDEADDMDAAIRAATALRNAARSDRRAQAEAEAQQQVPVNQRRRADSGDIAGVL